MKENKKKKIIFFIFFFFFGLVNCITSNVHCKYYIPLQISFFNQRRYYRYRAAQRIYLYYPYNLLFTKGDLPENCISRRPSGRFVGLTEETGTPHFVLKRLKIRFHRRRLLPDPGAAGNEGVKVKGGVWQW